MIFRIRFQVAGGHVHCRVFSAKQHNMTFAKLGDLCLSRGLEFREFMGAVRGVEFLPDEGHTAQEACTDA